MKQCPLKLTTWSTREQITITLVISLVHDYLEKHCKGVKQVMLQADNCVGQNKNNAFMQYIAWRVLTTRNHAKSVIYACR